MNKIIDKSDLVDVAASLFRQKGYAATSIDDIAKKVGLTKGSLYHHFAGKEDIAAAALQQVHDYFRANVFALLLDCDQPTAADLARFNHAVEKFFSQHPYGCLVANLSLEMGGAFELFRKQITAYFDEWAACYRKVFTQYLSKSRAAAEAQDAVAIVQGCLLMSRIEQDVSPLRRQHRKLLALCAA